MSDFRTVRGFEEVWRAPVTPRAWPKGRVEPAGDVRARLARLVARTPEVMVKVTGRTRDGGQLAAHLSYITRHGALEAEVGDAALVGGREDVRQLGQAWAFEAELDPRRRANTPISVSLMLSMPAGADPLKLREAARAFAAGAFGEEHDYLLVLHTDTAHPHVHLAVQALGRSGARLNPKKADLEAWRQLFARELRERGVSAEATPRRARGVTRKAERGAVRRLRERAARGEGKAPRVVAAAYREAAAAAFTGDVAARLWETRLAERQARVRALYMAQARLLQAARDAETRRLGLEVERFVRGMPLPDSQRLRLARELRDTHGRAGEREQDRRGLRR